MLLCNIINTLESLNLIFERINDFNLNLNSPVQLFLISFVIISIIVKFSGAFYASNIEIFLSKKIKKKTKKTSFLSSEKDIEKEIFMRYIGLFMICLVGFGMILRRRR